MAAWLLPDALWELVNSACGTTSGPTFTRRLSHSGAHWSAGSLCGRV